MIFLQEQVGIDKTQKGQIVGRAVLTP